MQTGVRDDHLDVAGEAALYRAFRHFWHPVMRSVDLGDRPARATLTGDPLMLARLGGEVRCFSDRCVLCGTALSLGWIDNGNTLRCGYHGCAYGPDGAPASTPGRFGPSSPERTGLQAFGVAERYGLIWVSLVENPVYPIPEFPEYGEQGYRMVCPPPYDWACSPPRRMENFVDFAHFAWVHDGLLGSRDRPEVPDHEVWREGPELRFYQKVIEPLQGATKEQLRTDSDMVEVENTYRLTMPLTIYLDRKFPGDNHYILVMTASPVGAKETRSFWFIGRNYAVDQPDEDFVRFEQEILDQDRPVVESQRPEELPVDLSAELHVRGVDRVSLDYRRWLIEIARQWGGLGG